MQTMALSQKYKVLPTFMLLLFSFVRLVLGVALRKTTKSYKVSQRSRLDNKTVVAQRMKNGTARYFRNVHTRGLSKVKRTSINPGLYKYYTCLCLIKTQLASETNLVKSWTILRRNVIIRIRATN